MSNILEKLLGFMESNYDDQIQCTNGCYFGDGYPKGTKHCYKCGNKTTLRKNLKCNCGEELDSRSFNSFCGQCGKSINETWNELKKKYN